MSQPDLPLTGVFGFDSALESGERCRSIAIRCCSSLGPTEDEVLVNCTRVQGFDGTDVEDLTEAEE